MPEVTLPSPFELRYGDLLLRMKDGAPFAPPVRVISVATWPAVHAGEWSVVVHADAGRRWVIHDRPVIVHRDIPEETSTVATTSTELPASTRDAVRDYAGRAKPIRATTVDQLPDRAILLPSPQALDDKVNRRLLPDRVTKVERDERLRAWSVHLASEGAVITAGGYPVRYTVEPFEQIATTIGRVIPGDVLVDLDEPSSWPPLPVLVEQFSRGDSDGVTLRFEGGYYYGKNGTAATVLRPAGFVTARTVPMSEVRPGDWMLVRTDPVYVHSTSEETLPGNRPGVSLGIVGGSRRRVRYAANRVAVVFRFERLPEGVTADPMAGLHPEPEPEPAPEPQADTRAVRATFPSVFAIGDRVDVLVSLQPERQPERGHVVGVTFSDNDVPIYAVSLQSRKVISAAADQLRLAPVYFEGDEQPQADEVWITADGMCLLAGPAGDIDGYSGRGPFADHRWPHNQAWWAFGAEKPQNLGHWTTTASFPLRRLVRVDGTPVGLQ